MRFAILIIALLIAADSQAQESKPSPDDGSIRSHQTGAELPDGLAFNIWVELLAAAAQGEHPDAALYLEDRMGLTEDRAKALLDALLASRTAMAEELDQATQQVLCGGGSSRSDEDLYRRYAAVDDLIEPISEKHRLLFVSSISPTEAERLQQVLRIDKANMSAVKLNHERRNARTGSQPANAVADICGALIQP